MMQNSDAETIRPSEIGWFATLVTRDGVTITVRAVLPTDGPILEDLFENVSPADLRFRFLSGLRHVDKDRIAQMVAVDYRNTISFLAFEGDRPVATAMLAIEPDRVTAEVAISVRTDMKGRGIGWTLLQHVICYAKANGIEHIKSTESRDNTVTIGLERDAGFEIAQCEGDPADAVASRALTED